MAKTTTTGPRMSADAVLLLLTVLPILLAVGDAVQAQVSAGGPVDWRLVVGAVLSAAMLALRELLRQARADAVALDREREVPPVVRVRASARTAALRKLIAEVGEADATRALRILREQQLEQQKAGAEQAG